MVKLTREITEDIVNLTNDPESIDAALCKYIRLKKVYDASSKFKQMILELRNSELKNFMKENFIFFTTNYYEYIDGTVPSEFNININGENKMMPISEIKDIFKHDAFIDKLSNLYSFIELKTLKKSYEIQILENLVKEMKSKNRYKVFCPYCQAENIEYTELDHYLPKHVYPLLSLFSENLIPTCKYCNSSSIKGDKIPKLPNCHPYKESPLEKNINFSFVDVSQPCKVEYDKADEKVCNYAELFKISERFSSHHFTELFKAEINKVTVRSKRQLLRSKASGNRINKNLIEITVQVNIKDRIHELLTEPEGYSKYKRQMLESISENQIKKIILSLYFYFNEDNLD